MKLNRYKNNDVILGDKRNGRELIFKIIVFSCFLILFLRLLYLQVLQGNEFSYLAERNQYKLVKIEATQEAEKFPTGDEKYYGRSEIDILNEVNNTISNTEDKYKSQKSYYNRKEVPYGTKDSVRPEGRSDGLNRTIEVKNYDIDKNSSSMISKIVEQAKERDIHLPEGNTQEVYIDIRNQNVSLVHSHVHLNRFYQNHKPEYTIPLSFFVMLYLILLEYYCHFLVLETLHNSFHHNLK